MKTKQLKIEIPACFVEACGRFGLDPRRYALGILRYELEPSRDEDGAYVSINGRAAEGARLNPSR